LTLKRLLIPIVFAAFVLPTAGLALAMHAKPAATTHVQVKVAKNATLGKILVNRKGFTLYHLIKENTGTIHCTGGCLGLWPPLLLPKGVSKPKGKGLAGKLGVIKRPDISAGARQITYDGWPLYTFANDTKPGQTNGQNFAKVWFAVPKKPKVKFKISITNSGSTVWGKVDLSYVYQGKTFKASCSKSSCTETVHAGVKVHLTETPTDSTTWPFSKWQIDAVNGGASRSSTNTTIDVKSHDDYNISAVYVLAYTP